MRISRRVVMSAACGAVLVAEMWASAGDVRRSPIVSAPVEPATLVLRNGKIVTVQDTRPEVQAVAVRGATIVALGTEADVKPFVGPATRVIDLNGALAIPGLIDSHAHFMAIGQARVTLDLMKAKNWEAIVAMVADAVKKARPGALIVGRGWHQEKWTAVPTPNIEGFPTHDTLSRISPDNPVILTHASGHATFANAKAMQLAGITADTQSPAGGDILRDGHGRPIGIFRETASGLLDTVEATARAAMTSDQLEAEDRKLVELADQECLAKGVTTLHDAGSSFETISRYRRMAEEGRLGIRIYAMVSDAEPRLAANLATRRMIGAADNHVTLRAIKVVVDGALGSRSAWLLEPYADMPTSTGINTLRLDAFRETARLAIDADYQMCAHAIGDRANRMVLDVYQEAFTANPARKDLRWRDEHAQHLHPTDIPRFGRLGVVAAMQGIHCTSDAPFVLARLGATRAEEGAYVWQKLMKTGAVVANGTDAPVEDVDPIANFYASVSRKAKDGSVFFGDQRMSRMDALRSYTINGAFAAFEERLKGSLEVGKLADVTIVSRDILTIPEDQIPAAHVLYTIVGGRVLYERK